MKIITFFKSLIVLFSTLKMVIKGFSNNNNILTFVFKELSNETADEGYDVYYSLKVSSKINLLHLPELLATTMEDDLANLASVQLKNLSKEAQNAR
tara:strand:- start:85 stop:372 length:288 start_codon:yes stop_codon:yes gene_type:complete